MDRERRRFLGRAAGLVAGPAPAPLPAGSPPVFGAAPPVGPEISPATVAEAEKLVQIQLTQRERAQAAGNWRVSMAPLYERRTGPRKVLLEPDLAPATRWNPVLPGVSAGPARDRFVRSHAQSAALPARDEDIAYAPVSVLSRWIEKRMLTSERLTRIYLDRLDRFDARLRCAITVTWDLALEQARCADAEIAAGKLRGPLHGIPWGAKDLLDTAGIATTYGAEPFRNRVPSTDAAVVSRLRESGAVLIAKLSLGALALNDVWFGGQTMNPWLLEEGSSGSSAGPGAATAAACVGFAIGSETGGSIVGPPSNLWARPAHRRHDALLVAGQAGADGARRRGYASRSGCHHRTGRRRRREPTGKARFRCDCRGRGLARRLYSCVDGSAAGDSGRSRCARNDAARRNGAGRSIAP
jgi:hypothetical protein